MPDCIDRNFELLSRRMLPASGRHRLPEPSSPVPPVDPPTAPLSRVPVLRGQDIELIRYCLAASEYRQQERRHAQRRVPWPTAQCVDVDLPLTRGVEGAT